MRHLLEADAESPPDHVDVVALLLRGLQKRVVRHEHRRSEVVGERGSSERSRIVGRQKRARGQTIENRTKAEEPDLTGELHLARPRREQLRDREHLSIGVESTKRRLPLMRSGDAHLHAVRLLQVPNESRVDVVAFELGVAPEILGGLLELGKVVHVLLNQIAHFLRRNVRQIEARLPLALEETRRERLGRFSRLVVGPIEREERARDRGAARRELANFRREHLLPLEQRIAERLEESGHDTAVFVFCERRELDPEELRRPDEQRSGKRAVVVFDQIEVRGRDAEPLGEIGLAQTLAPAKAANLGPEPGRLLALFGSHDAGLLVILCSTACL